MLTIPSFFVVDNAEPLAEEPPLPPLSRALLVIGLSLAAWVPVLMPFYLIFYR